MSNLRMNANKIVTISRNGQRATRDTANGATGDRSDWRKALSTLLSCYSDKAGQMFDGTANEFNVNNDIDLLMTSGYPEISLENNFNKPIANIYNGLMGKAADKANKLLKRVDLDINDIGGIPGAISILSAIGTGTINAVRGEGGVKTASMFQPWAIQMPAADTSKMEPVSFQYTFKFSMGQYGLWNAKEEVVKPILNLIVPTLPQYLNAAFVNPAFPSLGQLLVDMVAKGIIGRIAASDASEDTTTNNTESNGDFLSHPLTSISNALEDIAISATDSYSYKVQFGNFVTFNKCYIKSSKVNFSEKTDQFGYPVSGSVTLSFQSAIPSAVTSENANAMAIRYNL